MRLAPGIVIICFLLTKLSAQTAFSLGDPDPIIWLRGSDEPSGTRLVNVANGGTLSHPFDRSSPLNFNPTVIPSELEICTGVKGLDYATFLVVMQASSTEEQPLWMLEGEDSTTILMTSHRVADLKEHSFLNLLDRDYNRPYISSYYHRLNNPSQLYDFVLAPAPGAIPISPLHSGLAEILVFDRVISPMEKSQWESYLSIKYGVPLNQLSPTDYYNSKEEVIWNGKTHSSYNHDVFAIGRDHQLGLHQKQTDSGVLLFSAGKLAPSNRLNMQELPDGAFLFWSHDGSPLEWKEGGRLTAKRLSRNWLVVISDSMRHIETDVYLDPEELPVVPAPGEIWWLDQYVQDVHTEGRVYRSYPFVQSHQEGLLVASDIAWDVDGDGSDRFVLSAAPGFKLNIEIVPSNCQENSAVLDVSLFGGKGPYRIMLNDVVDHQIVADLTTDAFVTSFEGLAAGLYSIKAVDQDHQIFEKQIQIVHSNAIEIAIPDMAFRKDGTTLFVDAADYVENADVKDTKWVLPDGAIIEGRFLSVGTPGNYSILVEENGCQSSTSFEVFGGLRGNLKEVRLYPNPVYENNLVNAHISLMRAAPLDVEIVDVHGRLIRRIHLTGKGEYHVSEKMSTPGSYFLNVIHLHDTYSLPFVVL